MVDTYMAFKAQLTINVELASLDIADNTGVA
jgi:hypothetical protein